MNAKAKYKLKDVIVLKGIEMTIVEVIYTLFSIKYMLSYFDSGVLKSLQMYEPEIDMWLEQNNNKQVKIQ